jgi:hypothetical protein
LRGTWSVILLSTVFTGCVTSEPIDSPLGGGSAGDGAMTSGAAGTTGQAGMTGQAGTTGRVGTTGQAGTMGRAGTSGAAGTTGQAGTSGAAGTTGRAGTTGQAGNSGRDAGSDALQSDAGSSDALVPVPTFTELYTKYFNNASYASNCTGAPCHNPGTQKGLDFSTQAKGYTTVLAKIVVGAPQSSPLVSQLSSAKMPQTRPKMPAADQAAISAWIKAGAPNN